MIKGTENMPPTIEETQFHEEVMVEVEHKSGFVVQSSPKSSNDMVKEIEIIPPRDEDIEDSEKKDELQDTHATKEVQQEDDKGLGKAT